ncbi:T9SS type A sorting domain-containing protein [Flavobacterium sp. CYK-55]|uniref:T9SS type A sorting domain-containing protein n=1 Tax=Flavobacterium sp. CYK-55 TaxID=2835529 RepID=UPI001BCB5273|nr:T9SS type A sorting domain-containing protein [Flavobacterium sp. CYK-55]MBS7787306.1 T9SS type A sorting domain-containing protein [Flavobacterium sp. CYK-55]
MKIKTILFVCLSLCLKSFPQCNLTISVNNTQSGCYFTKEKVVFRNPSNVSISSNSITKVSGGNAWNAGASSTSYVFDAGRLDVIASETNKSRMIGLSSSDTNASFSSIQYAFYLENGTALYIYENGTQKTGNLVYTNGTQLSIRVSENHIKYFKDNQEVYTSSIVPTLPLLVDTSIYTSGGTLSNVTISNVTYGSFVATASSVGTSQIYTWKINGITVQSGSSNLYTNSSLNANDIITCELLASGIGACSTVLQNSNEVTIQHNNDPDIFDFKISESYSTNACITTSKKVEWDYSKFSNVRSNSNTLIKTLSESVWNGGASSISTVKNNGYIEFTASETNKSRMIGLSSSDINSSYTSIQYAFYLENGGALYVYENGVQKTGNIGYTTGTALKIAVENNVVKYYKDNAVIYSSSITPSQPLIVDVSMYNIGATLSNIAIANVSTGEFIATHSGAGVSPAYQWKLNGVNTGTNSNSYSNDNLANNDIITCELTADVDGCGSTIIYSNSLIIKRNTEYPSINFKIDSQSSTVGCYTAISNVKWNNNSTSNTFIDNNNMVKKTFSDNAWNGGASSISTVKNNGYIEFTASETNKSRMIGLSSSDINSSYTSIQYAFYLENGGALYVYENGVQKTGNIGYTTGTALKIAVENNVVKYYKDNAVIYSSSITPSQPLIVDVSMYNIGATLSNIAIANVSTGEFIATHSGAGVSPAYQWKLNGVNTGTNSNSYSNDNLANNDIITCELTADVDGCGSTIIYSNSLIIKNNTSNNTFNYLIEGTTSSISCKVAIEDIQWNFSSLNGVNVSGSNISKAFTVTSNLWDAGISSLNSVKNNGYMELTASETNKSRMIGLSSLDINVNYSTIQYAFYLENGGALYVYENGIQKSGNIGFTTGTQLKIAIERNIVKYYKDNVVVYISSTTPILPLIVDTSFYSHLATLSNIRIANYNSGTYTAITPVNVTQYQWKLNGSNVGSNSSTYTNPNLIHGDVLNCEITINSTGCSNSTIISNNITISAVENSYLFDYYISANNHSLECKYSAEKVAWNRNEISYCNINNADNSLIKTFSNNAWNGGTVSLNKVSNNGYIEFLATETNRSRMIGLSTININSSYSTIQCAFYLENGGALYVYENGISKTINLGYVTGTLLKISIENNIIKYYKNNSLVYTSLIPQLLPMLVDTSIYNVGGTIPNITIVNEDNGFEFEAHAVNLGSNPIYTWKINGNIAQSSSSSSYTNSSLSVNDVISCELTPDVFSCSSQTLTTNTIIIQQRLKIWTGAVNTDWFNANNWSPSGIPTSNDCVQINNTTNDPQISGSTPNAFGKNITVKAGGSIIVQPEKSLVITENINVESTGSLLIKDKANLLQINDNAINTGNISMERTTNVRKFDYVYWSAPVLNFNSSLVSPNTSSGLIFKWDPVYLNSNGGQGYWISGNETMQLGKGYIVRGPNDYSPITSSPFTATFNGKPNNGIIQATISRGSYTGLPYSGTNGATITNNDDNWNLIGNPYPSAIDANEFLLLNTNINGFVKIWSHGSQISNSYSNPFYGSYAYNYNPNDYITYNGTGSTPPGYNGKIGAGQGFFILMNDGTATSENVIFNNNLRRDSGNIPYNNSQFYRFTNPTFTDTSEKNRIWLSIIDPTNISSTTLIGYVENATNEVDRVFDAIHKTESSLGIYSKINNDTMIIQGRQLPFDQNDIVPIGITIPNTGTYSIAIDMVDGLFENDNQNIYIEDSLMNIIHDLKQSPYSFNSISGDYPDRFKLRYTSNSLNTDEIKSNDQFVFIKNQIFNIQTKVNIREISIFDISGKRIQSYKFNNEINHFSDYFPYQNGVYLISVELSDGKKISKKIIN